MKKNDWIRIVFDILIRRGYEDNKQDSISEWCTRDGFENPVYVKKIDLRKLEIPGMDGWIDSVAVTSLAQDFSDACDSDVRVAINDGKGHRNFLYINELSSLTVNEIATRVSCLETIEPKELNLWGLYKLLKEYSNREPLRPIYIILQDKEGHIIDRKGIYEKALNSDSTILVNGKDSVNIYVTI